MTAFDTVLGQEFLERVPSCLKKLDELKPKFVSIEDTDGNEVVINTAQIKRITINTIFVDNARIIISKETHDKLIKALDIVKI